MRLLNIDFQSQSDLSDGLLLGQCDEKGSCFCLGPHVRQIP